MIGGVSFAFQQQVSATALRRTAEPVDAAGPPPFLRAYESYWRGRGFAAPRLHRGIEDPVQSYDDDALVPLTSAARHEARRANGARLREFAKDGRLDDARKALRDLDNVDVDAADDNGWAPIHEAARRGDEEILGLLVARGADARKRTKGGDDALALARDAHGPDHAAVAYLARVHSEL